MKKFQTRGIAMVEVVIAASVCTLIVTSLLGISALVLKSSESNVERVQAAYLLEEGIEATRIMRDNSWGTNIATRPKDTNFYFEFDGSTWKATTTNIFIDGRFERRAQLSAVYRDANQNIVQSGGTIDTNILKETVYVSWNNRGATTTKSVSTYFTNIFNN